MPQIFGNEKPKKNVKKTRQGMGRGTKIGNKNSTGKIWFVDKDNLITLI